MRKLTAIDRKVKEMMLSFPSLFKDRMDALRQLFITYGNGYDWVKTKDGYVLREFSSADCAKKMRYDDLDEQEQRVRADIEADSAKGEISVLAGLYQRRLLEIERTRLLRKHVEDNIDTYACESLRDTFSQGFDSKIFRYFSKYSYLLSDETPWGEIEISYARAMDETLKAVLMTFNQEYMLHMDNTYKGGPKAPEPSMFSRMPEDRQKLYMDLMESRKKLSQQTGQLKRDAELSKMLTEILEEAVDKERR